MKIATYTKTYVDITIHYNSTVHAQYAKMNNDVWFLCTENKHRIILYTAKIEILK